MRAVTFWFFFANFEIRATHREDHPHAYAAQWTVSRTPNITEGGNFYFAHYGVRVQQAPNTLTVWKPSEPHGTSLPAIDPRAKGTPVFCQRAIAFVTSDRMALAWKEYQADRKSAEDALKMAEEGGEEGDGHGALYK